MRKFMNVKERLQKRVSRAKVSMQVAAVRTGNKLREQEGSLLEYLGEHIIGVVILGLAIAALVAIVKTVVIPNLQSNITNAFSAGSK